MPSFAAILDMLTNKIVNVRDPTNPQDAATKAYVDSLTSPTAVFPIGGVAMFGGLTAPTGWLFCDGSTVSRTTYPTLFAATCLQPWPITTTNSSPTIGSLSNTGPIPIGYYIGADNFPAVIPAGTTVISKTATTLTLSANCTSGGGFTATLSPFGIGNSSTTFTLPDMRRRFPLGVASNAILGASDGVVDSTLRSPAHRHIISGQATDPSPLAGGSGTGQPVRNNFFTGHDHGGQTNQVHSLVSSDPLVAFPNLVLNFIIRAT